MSCLQLGGPGERNTHRNARERVYKYTKCARAHARVLICSPYSSRTHTHTYTQWGINRSKRTTLEAQTQLVSLLWWMSGSQMDQRPEMKKREDRGGGIWWREMRKRWRGWRRRRRRRMKGRQNTKEIWDNGDRRDSFPSSYLHVLFLALGLSVFAQTSRSSCFSPLEVFPQRQVQVQVKVKVKRKASPSGSNNIPRSIFHSPHCLSVDFSQIWLWETDNSFSLKQSAPSLVCFVQWHFGRHSHWMLSCHDMLIDRLWI